MPNEKQAKSIKQQTLAEIVRAAKEAGMTYGKYVEHMEIKEKEEAALKGEQNER